MEYSGPIDRMGNGHEARMMKCDLCKQPIAAVHPVYRRLIANWRVYGVFCEAARREPSKGWLPSRPCFRCSRAVIRDRPERKSSLYFTCGHECRRAVHNAKYRTKRIPEAAPSLRLPVDVSCSSRLISTAIPVRYAVRPSAVRTIPAAAVPPIISMPMMTPVGTSDSSGGSSYGSAATTANGTSNNRTPQRALAKGFG
jgi:hypothetical protein